MTLAVSGLYQSQHDRLQRTPVYKVVFAGITDQYSTHRTGTLSVYWDETEAADETKPLDIAKAYNLTDPAEYFLADIFSTFHRAWTTTNRLPYMQFPKGVGARIEPERGRSSISSISFVLNDIDGNVTALIAEGLGGRICTLYMGFADIDEDEFVAIFTGLVSNYALTDDLTGYKIEAKDPQTLVDRKICECAATKLTAGLAATSTSQYTHYLTILQNTGVVFFNSVDPTTFETTLDNVFGSENWEYEQASDEVSGSVATVGDTTNFLSSGYAQIENEIIAYTGKTATTLTGLTRGALGTTAAAHASGAAVRELIRLGPAHPMDLIQGIYTDTDKTGCSIPASIVKSAVFDAVKASIGSSYQMELSITEGVNAKTLLEEQLYSMLACYPVTTGDGLLSVKEFKAPAALDSVATLDHDCIVLDSSGKPFIKWDGNFQSLINDVTVNFDFDPTEQNEDLKYKATLSDSDAASIAQYGRKPLVLNSKGFRSELAGTTDLINSRIALILDRYKNAAPIVKVRTHMQKNLIEPGEVVVINSALLPNQETGTRGVEAPVEVVNRAIDFPGGVTDFDVLWAGFVVPET